MEVAAAATIALNTGHAATTTGVKMLTELIDSPYREFTQGEATMLTQEISGVLTAGTRWVRMYGARWHVGPGLRPNCAGGSGVRPWSWRVAPSGASSGEHRPSSDRVGRRRRHTK